MRPLARTTQLSGSLARDPPKPCEMVTTCHVKMQSGAKISLHSKRQLVGVCEREKEKIFFVSLFPFILYAPSFLQGAVLYHLWSSDHRPGSGACEEQGMAKACATGHLASARGSVDQCRVPGPEAGVGALTFQRLGRSLEDTRNAGSGSRPGCYGRSQPQSSCGCPVHTRPGLGGAEEGDGRDAQSLRPSSEPPQPAPGAWVSGQLVLWAHSSHAT